MITTTAKASSEEHVNETLPTSKLDTCLYVIVIDPVKSQSFAENEDDAREDGFEHDCDQDSLGAIPLQKPLKIPL